MTTYLEYKNNSNNFTFQTGDTVWGQNYFNIIAGPCAIESEEQIIHIAKKVKKSGADMLRGGAFKPRTSPYSFQGLREEGLKLLNLAKTEVGIPTISEIVEVSHINLFEDVDIIQVGTRNMQNFELLKELGKSKKPILLKRGVSATIHEFLMSAEYILAEGNPNVILCERGIRTFETSTRNTLDLASIPLLRSMTHLPIIVDPSHATGKSNLILPMSMAGAVAGASGLMVEVHHSPEQALSDGEQAITPDTFDFLVQKVKDLLPLSY